MYVSASFSANTKKMYVPTSWSATPKNVCINIFKRQHQKMYVPTSLSANTKKMVKHSQIICRQQQESFNLWIICRPVLKDSVFILKETSQWNRRQVDTFRSSRLQMFFKIGVLKNFATSTGKHLFWSFFLIKLRVWRPKNSFFYTALPVVTSDTLTH